MPLDLNRLAPQIIANIEDHYKDPLGQSPPIFFNLDNEQLVQTFDVYYFLDDDDLLIITHHREYYDIIRREMGRVPKKFSSTLDLIAGLFDHVKGLDIPDFNKERSGKLFRELEELKTALQSNYYQEVEAWIAQLKTKFNC